MTTLCDLCHSTTTNKNCSLCMLDVSELKTDKIGMTPAIKFIRAEVNKAKFYEAKKQKGQANSFKLCGGCGMAYNTGFCDTCD